MNAPTTTASRRTMRLACAVAALISFSACSSDGDADDAADAPADAAADTTDAPGDAAAAVEASIVDFAFAPDPIDVVSGSTVTWTNNDGVTHTVTGTGELEFDSGPLASGESFTLSVGSGGEFAYVCTIHGQMSGTVIAS